MWEPPDITTDLSSTAAKSAYITRIAARRRLPRHQIGARPPAGRFRVAQPLPVSRFRAAFTISVRGKTRMIEDSATTPQPPRRADVRRRRRPHGGRMLGQTLDHLDQRTNAYKRRQQLLAAIIEEHGGELTLMQRLHAENVVRLAREIEKLEVRELRGESIDSDKMALLVREQHRELDAINDG